MDDESKERPDRPEAAEAAEQQAHAAGAPPAGEAGEAAGREEELRRRMEEQLRKVRVQDLLLESVVGIANLTARRLAKEDERDLEQARIGIEAMRAVVGLLESEPAEQVRNALSELQMLFARYAGGPAGPEGEPPGGEGAEGAGGGEEKRPPGGRDSRLWTPPGSA